MREFFKQMERYLKGMMESTDYSAAAIWKLAKAQPVRSPPER
jgi:cellulose synthase/poly-beta-1,6-N-acetylglucosamine synthase-like glycosyltransferase